MGRYDFRPLRVRQAAKALYETKRNPGLPGWYNIVGDIPPTETLARPSSGNMAYRDHPPS